MITLKPHNSGCIIIQDGAGFQLPFQRGELLPRYDVGSEKMALFLRHDINAPVVNMTAWDKYINGITEAVFASYAELLAFVADNMFMKAAGGSNTDTTPQTFVFEIKEVPAGGNEKPTGVSLTASQFENCSALPSMVIATPGGGAAVYVENVHYTRTSSTTITFVDGMGAFLADDIAVVTGINNF